MINLIVSSKSGHILFDPKTLDAISQTLGDCDVDVYFEKHSNNKTRKAVGYYFAGIVKNAADYFGWSKEDMHEHLKSECNKKEIVDKDGEIHYIGASTKPLSKKEYAEFVNRCIVYLAEKGFDCGEPIHSEENQ